MIVEELAKSCRAERGNSKLRVSEMTTRFWENNSRMPGGPLSGKEACVGNLHMSSSGLIDVCVQGTDQNPGKNH